MRYGEQEPELLHNNPGSGGEDSEPTGQQCHSTWVGLFTAAETLSVAAILASTPTLVGLPGPVQTITLGLTTTMESFSRGLALGFGIAAAAGVLLAWSALSRSGPRSQPWTRWLAGGVLIVELPILAAVVAAGVSQP